MVSINLVIVPKVLLIAGPKRKLYNHLRGLARLIKAFSLEGMEFLNIIFFFDKFRSQSLIKDRL